MGLASAIWDTAEALIVWATAKADEVDGQVLSDVGGDDRHDTENLALPGFYSIIAKDDQYVILRRDDGGVILGAKTARPTGYAAGDRGILTSGSHLRVRGNMISALTTGASAPLAVGRNGDDCNRNANMITWMGQVEAALNALAPGAVTAFATYGDASIADLEATATRLEAD